MPRRDIDKKNKKIKLKGVVNGLLLTNSRHIAWRFVFGLTFVQRI